MDGGRFRRPFRCGRMGCRSLRPAVPPVGGRATGVLPRGVREGGRHHGCALAQGGVPQASVSRPGSGPVPILFHLSPSCFPVPPGPSRNALLQAGLAGAARNSPRPDQNLWRAGFPLGNLSEGGGGSLPRQPLPCRRSLSPGGGENRPGRLLRPGRGQVAGSQTLVVETRRMAWLKRSARTMPT